MDLPDILDLMGFTPREFGALHACLERVDPIDRGRVVAQVLLQGAFAPMPKGGTVRFGAAGQGENEWIEVGTCELPAIDDGAVIRLKVPLKVPEATSAIAAQFQAPAPSDRAKRVRPAWKLHDTFEIPKLSEMEPITDGGDVNVGMSLLGTGLMGGGGFVIFGSRSTTIEANNKVTVHRARELPTLSMPISKTTGEPIEAPTTQVVWRPGQPLPERKEVAFAPSEPALPPPKPRANAMRHCPACGFEGKASEYERARSCPSCDAPWY